jgi:alpha-ketoglutaric semialdehyde dehydrogenase
MTSYDTIGAAHSAFEQRILHPPAVRAALLRSSADALEAVGDDLVATAAAETALTEERLRGELARTTGQLRLFADEVDEGVWLEARLDTEAADLRSMNVPIGPVVVFAASNFPFAFSVPGGDTASAFAAGCPVVVKAHPAHPRTSELAGEALHAAVASCALPAEVFGVVFGDVEVGLALVDHPATAAVAFTGSLEAGRALFDLAAARAVPIPVYAEMGSINPVFVLPGAVRARGSEIAGGLSQSVTLGVGQFCTNPGVTIGVDLGDFAGEVAALLGDVAAGTMLYPGIGTRYETAIGALQDVDGVDVLAGRAAAGTPACALTTGAVFTERGELAAEVFGPSTLVVSCQDSAEVLHLARGLAGQLSATIHADVDDPDDLALAGRLVDVLTDKVGRIVWNGFPTGVAVTHAMQHGGPYPASTDSRTTSVGTAAMRRFLRPVCYQGLPAGLLPEPLLDDNPSGRLRRLDGAWSRESLPR